MENLTLELPHDLEAEISVLGGMMSEFKTAQNFFAAIKPEWFYSELHRKAFVAMGDMMAEGIEPDIFLVWERLRRDDPEVSASRISSMTDTAGFNIKGYTDLMRGKYANRREIEILQNGIAKAIDEGAMEGRQDILIELAQLRAEMEEGKTTTKRDAALQMVEELELRAPLQTMITGVEELDDLTGGFRPGEMVIYCAETGTGKTLLAQQTARTSCAVGLHGLFVSCEMLSKHLAMREVASRTEISVRALRHPESLSEVDYKRVFLAARNECPICETLDGNRTFNEISRAASKMRGKLNLSWVIIDYDELVDAPGRTELERLLFVAAASKRLALQFEIPVILISQLRKAQGDEAKHPITLSRLYGTGAKSKHATVVVYVERPFVQKLEGDEAEARFVLMKSRDSQIRRFKALFDIKTLAFRSTGEEAR